MQKYRGIADRILFDAPAQALPGGTGTRFDWSLLKNHRHTMDWGIAGGLDPSNVAAAIAATGAPLVDVSTGVESAPSVKDVDKMAAFLKAARSEEHTSELQSLMRNSYAVFCLKKKKQKTI